MDEMEQEYLKKMKGIFLTVSVWPHEIVSQLINNFRGSTERHTYFSKRLYRVKKMTKRGAWVWPHSEIEELLGSQRISN